MKFKKNKSTAEKAAAPTKKAYKIKPFSPAKQDTTADELPEMQGAAISEIEDHRYRAATLKALKKAMAKMPDIKFFKLKGTEEHFSKNDPDEKGKVVSVQAFVDDGQGGGQYKGTLHATVDGDFSMRQKKGDKYVKSSEL